MTGEATANVAQICSSLSVPREDGQQSCNVYSPIRRQPRLHSNLRSITGSDIRSNTAKIHRHDLSSIPTRSSTSTLLRQREIRSSGDVLGQVHSNMRRIESASKTFARSLRIRDDMLCCQTSREGSGKQQRRQLHFALLEEGLTRGGGARRMRLLLGHWFVKRRVLTYLTRAGLLCHSNPSRRQLNKD